MEIRTNKRTWYSLAKENADEIDVYIYDEIGGWGVSAKSFIEEMSFLPAGKSINLRINSPGGDVFDALAIFNYLGRRSETVRAYVDGMAASSASILAMAGDEIIMPENAMMFLHNPWSIVAGNSDQLEKEAEALSKIQGAIVGIYANRSGQSIEKIQQLMDDETWLSADEAVELGLATRADVARQVAAKYDATLYKHIPDEVAARFKARKEKEVMADEPKEPVVEPQDKKEPDDPRAEFKQFVAKFGAERAAKFYAEGVSFADAEVAYVAELERENAELKSKKVVDVVKPAPFDGSDNTVKTFADAVRECGGGEKGYVAARKKYPDLHKESLKGKAK